ncbi:MAG TPA: toprim domain-containing protein, partial [Pseudonocardiaceae bacterium]|nr:toprim domain-containing protein [Pseudonocardiaceae bacterium]
MTAETLYGADDLTHLEGLEAVRKRPGMYIGSTDSRGINHLFSEIVDNSTDEGIAGSATKIVVTLHADGSVQVDDDGRGIPTGTHAKSGLSGVELVLTRLHAGGKFGGSGYKTSGGLHGVGASAVNALSRRFDVTVKQDGKIHQMSFAHGVPGEFDGPGPKAKFTQRSGLQLVGKMKRGESSGTSIRYWYDPRYFDNGSALDVAAVEAKLRNTAFLVPGVKYVLRQALDDRIEEQTFHFANGLLDMVEFLTPDGERPVSGILMAKGEGIYYENAADENGVMRSKVERRAEVEVAFRWGTGYERTVECFTNTIRNVHGGTHRRGFDRAVTRAMQDVIGKTRGLLKAKEDPPTLDDVFEGMTAVIHVRIPEPQFTSQTKDDLSTAGITKVVQAVVEKHIKAWVEDRKTRAEAKVVLQKVVDASRVRLTQKQQKDAARRKTALEGAAMPAKLVDCRINGIARSELFLVEGDSALGSAKMARVSEFQALLPLRGKILNVQKASLADTLRNAEIAAIVQVLGAGSGRTFELSQMRYGRVILMADADVDGSHIRTLLITLFAKYMRPVIEDGRLYAAMPPLHKVVTKGRNPETHFTFTQREMEQTVTR